MPYFIDVILPIPVERRFTYAVNQDEAHFLKKGMRVAVPFGKTKIYAAIVYAVHQNPPTIYKAKDIEYILDEGVIVTENQLKLWVWMASYYMCSEGEVMRASIPSALLLESETVVTLSKDVVINQQDLNQCELQLLQLFNNHSELTVQQIITLLERRTVLPLIQGLITRGLLAMREELFEKYKPKIIKFIQITTEYAAPAKLNELLALLNKAPKQKHIVLSFFSLKAKSKKPITTQQLQKETGATSAQLKALVNKGVFEIFEKQKDRVTYAGSTVALNALNADQDIVYNSIKEGFKIKPVCLLHGVTSSGKTEVYVHLIASYLAIGKQVLYLLPEIALTTQLIGRLQAYFGDKVAVFHSRYSINERVEVYANLLQNSPKAQLIIGARSAVLLPFSNLGLIVVDEEHERSFKQFDPSPRYNARDTAIVLGLSHKAHVLLGSATPAIETMYNAQQGKYNYVVLARRYGNVKMPKINLIDFKEKRRKRQVKGHFSDTMLMAIEDVLDNGEQVILFQNRRGFAPVLQCNTCGHAPSCPNCDVSLTYHKHRSQLRCHYCGYQMALQQKCQACGSHELDTKGFGTEQIEAELKVLFPKYNSSRMDSDTTRGKYGYQKIINAFENGEIDILVGTQMLTKGLDFRNVSLVGVLNADSMLNIPDFRAHERSYQLIAQVSGRAGRTKKQGKVLVQTYNPYHQILQQVSVNDYGAMFKEQLQERSQFNYPPYYKLIKIILKHRDFQRIEEASVWLGTAFENALGKDRVLGPELPVVSRVRNQYLRVLMIKIETTQRLSTVKDVVLRVRTSFQSIAAYRSVRFVIDVDPQ